LSACDVELVAATAAGVTCLRGGGKVACWRVAGARTGGAGAGAAGVAGVWWVAAGPPGTDAPSIQALARTQLVDVLGGVVAQETWRRLAQQGLQAARSERGGRGGERAGAREPREPVRLQPGEAAVVPLSLAGSAAVTRLDVPPLLARALGVRASQRPDASRAFLDFLASEKGNAAFRGCGRADAR